MAAILRGAFATVMVSLALGGCGGTRALARAPLEHGECVEAPPEAVVRLETTLGEIDLELAGSRAPVSVCNFLRYVTAGLYEGGSFARTVRPDNQTATPVKIAVIQGDIREAAQPFPAIRIERTAQTGLHHRDGTVSMARGEPDTATSGFFICIGAQPELDFGGARNPDGQGFAAFGQVIRGMDVVRRIWLSAAAGERLTPPIVIRRVSILRR